MNTAWSKPTKYIVGVGLALLGLFVVYLSRSVIPLLILAALLAVIVRPLVLWLHQGLRLPRGLAVALVYLVVLIIAPLAMLLIVPAVINALRYVIGLDYDRLLQSIIEGLRAWLISFKAAQLPVNGLDAYVDPTIDTLLAALQPAAPAAAPDLPPVSTIIQSLRSALTATFGAAASLVGAVLSSAVLFIFIFLASIYISLGMHTYRESFLGMAPDAYRAEFAQLLLRIERVWNAFFRGQITLMIVIGFLSWLGLTILGVPGALYLGIIAGLLELIPNLGPIIATLPAVIVALLQGSSYLPVSNTTMALLVIVFYVLLQQLENSVVVPRVLGDAVELPPLVVMSGVLVGTSVGGILGALLATPLIATTRELVRYAYRKLQNEDPFPASEALPPEPDLIDAALPPAAAAGLRAWLRRLYRARHRLTRPREASPAEIFPRPPDDSA